MFSNQNKIIIVDNNAEHIEILNRVFADNFIKCDTFQYDFFNKNEIPLQNVRIAFFDLNLGDIVGNNNAVYNDLANALNEFISPDNGLFALVFWTQNSDLINEFIQYINIRRPETPKPFSVSVIDKHDFLDRANNEGLFKIIKEILNQPYINLLFDFENRVKNIAAYTINQLYNIIPNTEWGNNDSFNNNFDLVFSKIAIGSLGYDHAKENPDKAIYEALMPLVSNNVINSIDSDLWKNLLVTLSKSRKNAQPDYPNDFKSSTLNSIFHVDLNSNKDLKARGIIIEINIDQKFTNLFSTPFNDWYSRLLPGLNRTIRKESIPIAIEISASCDYSQLKPRAYKYLLGVLVKSIHKEFLDKEKIPQSLFILDGNYNILEDEYFICFNLNFAFSVVDNHEIFVKGLFSLKKRLPI
ncbi:hypothetical protein [Flavobacterium davisii]|uniref:Uncharacterized protein n=1 Tax=Flavobacterium columnare TaxID=996 RepID=A0A8G0KX29_9FLAO|nr:hypothetical protein [Flavobacterium davisii]QYS89359.1 hypothetical protein JJC05_03135 [Flavobacterium davisii]